MYEQALHNHSMGRLANRFWRL